MKKFVGRTTCTIREYGKRISYCLEEHHLNSCFLKGIGSKSLNRCKKAGVKFNDLLSSTE